MITDEMVNAGIVAMRRTEDNGESRAAVVRAIFNAMMVAGYPMERMEQKLDTLIAALAQCDEDEETTTSLDGLVSRERDETQPL